MKKIFSCLVALILLVGATLPVSAITPTKYTDFMHRGQSQYLYEMGVTKLAPKDTNFYGNLQRRHVSLLMKRLFLDLKDGERLNGYRSCEFSDTSDMHPSDRAEIIDACKFGIMQGSGKYLRPYDSINKGELFIIMARMLSGDGSISSPQEAIDILRDIDTNLAASNAIIVASHDVERRDVYDAVIDILSEVFDDKTKFDILRGAAACKDGSGSCATMTFGVEGASDTSVNTDHDVDTLPFSVELAELKAFEFISLFNQNKSISDIVDVISLSDPDRSSLTNVSLPNMYEKKTRDITGAYLVGYSTSMQGDSTFYKLYIKTNQYTDLSVVNGFYLQVQEINDGSFRLGTIGTISKSTFDKIDSGEIEGYIGV